MQYDDVTRHAIRDQVLRAITLNRHPGYHFCGNFLDTAFTRVSSADSRVELNTAAHCADADGQLNIGAFALLADVALATSIRAGVDRATRLATVSLNLQLTGAARTGRLEAATSFEGYVKNAAGRQGMSRLSLRSESELLCFGSGTFMVMPPPRDMALSPHPMPWRGPDAPPIPLLDEKELRPDELWILRHAEASLKAGITAGIAGTGGFINHFLGYLPRPIAGGAVCELKNGPHVANRVGHVQGGITLGLAAATASAALPRDWALTGLSACYLSPGEGETLMATSTIVHHGRFTAVVNTQVTGINRRRVLELVSTHAALAGTGKEAAEMR